MKSASKNRLSLGAALAALSIVVSAPAHAQGGTPGSADQTANPLLAIPLEDLLTMEATSVAKKRQKVSDASAAVYIITQDDIRRSTATTIPELLRMVPGMEVTQMQNSQTGVTARGFNGLFGNTLLVMIDGRAIYFSSTSGVLWDQQLIPLSNIERIEVVRGPGATLWGSNAVNGVVNIISKHSIDTQGFSADVRVGTRQQSAVGSFGGRMGESLSYRVHANYRRDLELVDAQGHSMAEPTTSKSVGARIDYEPNDRDAFTVQSDYAKGDFHDPLYSLNANLLTPGYTLVNTENTFDDFNILGRWTHKASNDLDFTAQVYYNNVAVHELGIYGKQDVADIDLGMRWRASATHEFNFGVGARLHNTNVIGTPSFGFAKSAYRDRWLSGYIQDDITLVANKLHATIGTKLEHNNFTGFEVQPSLRLLFKPTPKVSLWSGVSRAVRTPSIYERFGNFGINFIPANSASNPLPIPVYPRIFGSSTLGAEHLTAYEGGVRGQIGANWTFDVSGFYNVYDHLTSADLAGYTPLFQAPVSFFTNPPTPLGLQANAVFGNTGRAHTIGFEGAVSGHLKPWWKVDFTYSHFATIQSASTETSGSSPHDQFGVRSAIDLGDSVSFDSAFRYVGALANGSAPAYSSLDLRVTYRPSEALELSVIGKDLLSDRHREYGAVDYPAPQAYVPRTASIEARIRF